MWSLLLIQTVCCIVGTMKELVEGVSGGRGGRGGRGRRKGGVKGMNLKPFVRLGVGEGM